MGQLGGKVALTGVFNGINAAAPAMPGAAPASIINIPSIAGLQAYETLSGCTASKFAAVAPPAV
ncbi:NADP-dependent 3-hydroxy acid dehydrogenase YdfG [Pseudarthrobacter oxydans]|uniref:SDR family NAD(P)-dependent oxidoreductase n=1 Tax=Pseudarthrobacter oxydans TaxID=1671 RepID=UPI0027841DAE|nr:SDR family NAD(P)-dependent oxidoreductase [Pseudarthrobacter oxydans]MDP9980670.1 NADP-dependent 3-hydroxy acid dehydrogenase YdfG [Pseudarthrobacter oxydans]